MVFLLSETKNYKLYVTNDEEEDTFSWVQKMGGENQDSNMQKIDKVLGDKSDHSKCIEVILTVDGWSEDSPYSQTLQIDEIISSEQNGILSSAQGITVEQLEVIVAAGLYISNQADGSLTISASGDRPTCDIPVLIILLD